MNGKAAEWTLGSGDQVAHRSHTNRAFRILMAGSSVSLFGSRISTIAFPMLVLHLSGSPSVAGFVVFAAIVPSVLIYIPAGAMVDRLDPKRVMLVSEFGRGIAVAFVVISLATGKPSVRLLIAVMVVEEILEIFSTLSERRYINCLIERGEASYAQSCIEVRAHTVVLAGRPIGPFLFELSPILPFLADAASFAFSVASLICIKGRRAVPAQPAGTIGKPLRRDIGDGFRWLRRDKQARTTVALMASTTLIAQALIMIVLAEAHEQRMSTAAIGVILAASGLGGVAGSMVAGWLPREARKRWLQIQMCAWSAALAFLAVSGGQSVPWIAAAMIVLGFTGAIGNVKFGTYLVQNVPDNMIAKVSSIGQVMAIGACALGPALGGVAIQRYGVRGAVFLLFLAALLLAATSFWTEISGYFLRPMEWLSLAGVALDTFGRRLQAYGPAEVRQGGYLSSADEREAAMVFSDRLPSVVMADTAMSIPLASC
jgi:MFS family permease